MDFYDINCCISSSMISDLKFRMAETYISFIINFFPLQAGRKKQLINQDIFKIHLVHSASLLYWNMKVLLLASIPTLSVFKSAIDPFKFFFLLNSCNMAPFFTVVFVYGHRRNRTFTGKVNINTSYMVTLSTKPV